MQKLLAALGIVAIVAVAGGAYMLYGGGSSTEANGDGSATTGTAPAQGGISQSGPAQTAQNDAQPAIYPDDRILGAADAPVTIIEYASLTCPHCAAFHRDVLPEIKSEFIDKGQVRLVFRDFPLDRVALQASLLAQCVPGDSYFNLLDVLFRSQESWARNADPAAALKQIGRTAGLDEATLDNCLEDQAALDRIALRYKEGQDVFQVDSTPTFIVNGKKVPGGLAFEDSERDGQIQPGFGKLLRDLVPKT